MSLYLPSVFWQRSARGPVTAGRALRATSVNVASDGRKLILLPLISLSPHQATDESGIILSVVLANVTDSLIMLNAKPVKERYLHVALWRNKVDIRSD